MTLSQSTIAALGPVTNLNSIALIDCVNGGARGVAPITFTFNQSMGNTRRIGGSQTSVDLQILPTWNGVNAPIALTGI